MSKVISFRLDKNNPREAQALERLNQWMDRGYSVRFILTQALLGIDDIDAETKNQSIREHDLVIDQLNRLFELLSNPKTKDVSNHNTDIDQIMLRESFLSAVKQGIKPGVKHEG